VGRELKWSTAPSGREIVDRDRWERIANWAHRAYSDQRLGLQQVVNLLNRRYPPAAFHEAGVRMLFDDFLLPLRPEDRAPTRASRPGDGPGARHESFPQRHLKQHRAFSQTLYRGAYSRRPW
jgi:hypothetical protein